MEEKEARTAPQAETEEVPTPVDQTADISDTPGEAEEAPQEDKQLYFGRFTAGVWHGGILGLALGYILIGVLGLLDSKFSFGIRGILENPIFKYGLMVVLMYVLGKLGGHIEKQRENESAQD
ncbi:MAG: hypothetical protein Q3Y08_02950 [Butyricicoccus sp.]|nr:hypothetical protein [Butyricicoccus sp.]